MVEVSQTVPPPSSPRIERATPAGEGWVVTVERCSDTIGRVVLEMADGDEREVGAGMALLLANQS